MNLQSIITEALAKFLNASEEMGAIATHLREAGDESDLQNEQTARMCLDDAMDAAANLETYASQIGAAIAKAYTI
jgi:hypothetical protein